MVLCHNVGMRRLFVALLLAASALAGETSFPLDEPGIAPALLPFLSSHAYATARDGDILYVIGNSELARIGPEGTLLDRVSKQLPGIEASAAAAGAGMLVVTHEDSLRRRTTHGLDPEGNVLWSHEGIGGTHVVFSGRHFIVGVIGREGIFVTFIEPSGRVVRHLRLWPPKGGQLTAHYGMAMARTEGGVLLVWIESTRSSGALVAARIDDGGVIQARREVAPVSWGAGDVFQLAMASPGGNEALLVYTHGPNWTEVDVRALRLNAHGEPLGAPETLAVKPPSPASLFATWDGNRYRVTWKEAFNDERIIAVDVDRSGVLERHAEVGRGSSTKLDAAGGHLFLFSIGHAESQLRAKRIDVAASAADLAGAAAEHVLLEPAAEYTPAVTWTGDRYLAVWVRQAEKWELRARTFDALGRPLSEPVTILGGIHTYPAATAVAANGRTAVAVVVFGDQAWFVVLSADGIPQARAVHEVPGFAVHATIASDGDGFLLPIRGLHALRTLLLDSEGVVAKEQEHPADYDVEAGRVDAVFDGRDYQVSYSACPDGVCYRDDQPHIARVDRRTGAILETRQVTEQLYFDGGALVAANGDDLVYAWKDIAGINVALLSRDTLLPVRTVVLERWYLYGELTELVWTGTSWFGVTDRQETLAIDAALTRIEAGEPSSRRLGAAAGSHGSGAALQIGADLSGRASRMRGTFVGGGKRRAVTAE